MRTLKFIQILALILIVFLSPFTSTAAEYCPEFSFTKKSELKKEIKKSLAKVYDDQNATDMTYQGTATVIDAKLGLLLTARHVIKDEQNIWVSFPAHYNYDKTYRAELKAEIKQVKGELEEDGRAWDKPRDLAVLKLIDYPVDSIKCAEISPTKIEDDRKLHFFSFHKDAIEPVTRDAVSHVRKNKHTERPAKCTRHWIEITLQGDSGAPVINERGLVVGVLLTQRYEKVPGTYLSLTGGFIPAKCFAKWLWKVVGDMEVEKDKTVSKNSFDILATKEKSQLTALLLPPPDRPEWLTNLRLASGVRWLIEHKDEWGKNEELRKKIEEKSDCPIRDALYERGLGWDLIIPYLYAFRPTSESQKKGAQDSFKEGYNLQMQAEVAKDKSRAVYLNDKARTALNVSDNLYQSSIATRQREMSRVQYAQTPPGLYRFFAESYKGLADVQIRKGFLTNEKKYFKMAIRYAAKAAEIATDRDKELKGSALGALGVAAQNLGDEKTAKKAYHSAAQLGYKTAWINKNYDELEKKNIPESKFCLDQLNQLPPVCEVIDDKELKQFSTHSLPLRGKL